MKTQSVWIGVVGLVLVLGVLWAAERKEKEERAAASLEAVADLVAAGRLIRRRREGARAQEPRLRAGMTGSAMGSGVKEGCGWNRMNPCREAPEGSTGFDAPLFGQAYVPQPYFNADPDDRPVLVNGHSLYSSENPDGLRADEVIEDESILRLGNIYSYMPSALDSAYERLQLT